MPESTEHNRSRDFDSLHVSSHPEHKNILSGMSCVFTYTQQAGIWHTICASQGPDWLEGFYSYSEFKSLSVIRRCPVNMNILVGT
jgi:hypothetical protein